MRTLDPLADGVLVVLVGKSTKLQDTLMAGKKTYRVILKLGVTTDTGDVTGTTLKESRVDADGLLKLDDILNSFKGEIEQVPPMYSALKYGGKRLYELARQGLEVKREPRGVTIYSIDMLSKSASNIGLRVECSKGTYIRTLVEDIGAKLGWR